MIKNDKIKKIKNKKNNQRNFERENNRTTSTNQKLITEQNLDKMESKIKLDQMRIIVVSLEFAILDLLSF